MGACAALAGLPCQLVVLAEGGQDVAKRPYVESLGASRCAVRRPGRNDRLMLAARLGIAVMKAEGVAVETLLAARVAVPGVAAALGLLLNPARLVATLRT